MRKAVRRSQSRSPRLSGLSDDDPLFSDRGIPSNYAPSQMDPRVPTPEKVLGFKVGERFATHAEVGAYVRAVAAAVPRRVRWRPTAGHRRAATPRGRGDSPENHARFEEIAGKIRALYSPTSSKPARRRGSSRFRGLSYGVHGTRRRARRRDRDFVPPGRLPRRPTADCWRRVVLTMTRW